MKTVNSYIGAPLKRFEDFRFLTGRGQYVGDLKRERLLHAGVLRSPIAHGMIVAIDTARARAMPGVLAVITAADIGANVPRIPMRQEPMPELLLCEQPVIADGKVRYVGEPVAVVLAESAEVAEDAAQVIELSIDALPAVVDGREHKAVAMEPRGLMAEWDTASGRMTLHGATKVPFTNRRILARTLGLKEEVVT